MLQSLADKPGLSNEALSQELGDLAHALAVRRKQFDDDVIRPLKHLAAIVPLLADAARFVALAKQQEDLAERMAALRGRDGSEDPSLRARMRELEAEQRQLREALRGLLADIEARADHLPDEPPLDILRQKAKRFVKDVGASGAAEAMAGAESALAEMAGTRAHERAAEAAKILARFIKSCEGGDAGEDSLNGFAMMCLGFQPGLKKGLGNTVAQLLSDMALGMGSDGDGFGPGLSGYSSQRGGNVGLYGSLPGMDAVSGNGEGNSVGDAGGPGESAGGGSNPDAPGQIELPGSTSSGGSSAAAVPPSYRRRVGEYFQRLNEEAPRK
jgi:hypothetical protein